MPRRPDPHIRTSGHVQYGKRAGPSAPASGLMDRTRPAIQGAAAVPAVGQRMRVFVARHTREDLAVLKELAETGKVAPVIDRHYSLTDVPEALRYQGEGHPHGKIVIVV